MNKINEAEKLLVLDERNEAQINAFHVYINNDISAIFTNYMGTREDIFDAYLKKCFDLINKIENINPNFINKVLKKPFASICEANYAKLGNSSLYQNKLVLAIFKSNVLNGCDGKYNDLNINQVFMQKMTSTSIHRDFVNQNKLDPPQIFQIFEDVLNKKAVNADVVLKCVPALYANDIFLPFLEKINIQAGIEPSKPGILKTL